MTFGEDPFKFNKYFKGNKTDAIKYFVLFLVLWYILSHH